MVSLQAVAVILGIGAAAYRFIKEEPHTTRLRLTLSGTADVQEDTIYLRVRAAVENNGQVAVSVDPELTALEISARRPGDENWKNQRTESIFGRHEWVRPGEEIVDRVWVEIPYDGEVGVGIDLFVAEEEETVWSATEIVSLFTKERGISSDDG